MARKYPLNAEDIGKLTELVDKEIGESIAQMAQDSTHHSVPALETIGELYALRAKLTIYPTSKGNGPAPARKVTRKSKVAQDEAAT